MQDHRTPTGELQVRTLAMPGDANPNGDIFGGWVLSQMDIAGGIAASGRSRGRVATVAVNAMTFKRPVYVGDVLCCYTNIERVGNTSMTIRIEAWALRRSMTKSDDDGTAPSDRERVLVTEGSFTFVAINNSGRPRAVPDAI